MTIRRYAMVVLILLAGTVMMRAQGPDAIAFGPPLNIEFMSGPIALENEPVTGAPYSAEAVTDIVQTLSDGNRIVRQNKAQVNRDGQGRTRREQGLAMFGPLVSGPSGPSGDEPRNAQISDPTTGSMIMLDLQNRTAHKMPVPRLMLKDRIAGVTGGAVMMPAPRLVLKEKIAGVPGEAGIEFEKFEMAVPPPLPPLPGGGVGHVIFNRMRAPVNPPPETPVVESLGTQSMEGLAVEGTRTTVTIPAGQIGNELPIHVVAERWFSPDLKVLVMSRQSDPRFGETTYRLTDITRTEPPPQLFEIPPDFKIVDAAGMGDVFFEKKIMR